MPEVVVFGISTGFPELSRSEGQIAHVLLTRSPLVYSRRSLTARLACVKHAASVRPEPGSNSPLNSCASNPEATDNSWLFFSRQENDFTDYCQNHRLSYQRNRRRLIDRPKSVVRSVGRVQNNSSTFGTLLSSQGSSAHRGPASRPFQGATCKNLPGSCGGVKSASRSQPPCAALSTLAFRGR